MSDLNGTVWRGRCYVVLGLWCLSMTLTSFSSIRGLLICPLFVHDDNASGQYVYVMADGPAYWERLRAASDLYHLERVDRILILKEQRTNGYNFSKRRSETRTERAIDFLASYGVPHRVVLCVPEEEAASLGTLSEARGVAKRFPRIESLVIVTSAPHTRRSLLSFRRVLPESVRVQVYSASPPQESSEINSPIWIEYAKLLVYYFWA